MVEKKCRMTAPKSLCDKRESIVDRHGRHRHARWSRMRNENATFAAILEILILEMKICRKDIHHKKAICCKVEVGQRNALLIVLLVDKTYPREELYQAQRPASTGTFHILLSLIKRTRNKY